MDRHDDKVSYLSYQVKGFFDRKETFHVYHGSTNRSQRQHFNRRPVLDISHLSSILRIDEEKMTALTEPNVPMANLLEATLEVGLMPLVVVNPPALTVGKGFLASSRESSSFKYGGFENSINWVEMILGDGDIVIASKKEHLELLIGARGSFGTLGVITLLEIQLIPAKRFVELTYYPAFTVFEAVRTIDALATNLTNDYVDGLVFGENHSVIMVGRLTNTPKNNIKLQRSSRARDQWFYRHARRVLDRSKTATTEVIPLVDYLFRYHRSGFWNGIHAFKCLSTPSNRVTQWMHDTLLKSNPMWHASHASKLAANDTSQHIAIPSANAAHFIEYLDKFRGVYPIMLCPVRRDTTTEPAIALPTLGDTSPLILDVGIWGFGKRRTDRLRSSLINRDLEQRILSLSGVKCLTGQVYYTEDEFWSIYDRRRYDELRAKYCANTLPTLWDMVKPQENDVAHAQKYDWKSPKSRWPHSEKPSATWARRIQSLIVR